MKRFLLVLFLFSSHGLLASPAQESGSDQPTVTREEADHLAAASGIAATNLVAAIARLEPHRGPGASAALDFAVGNFHYQSGAFAPAIDAYQAALAKKPAFRSARMNLARLLLMRDDAEGALAELQQLAAGGQSDADLYLLMGHALLLTDAPVSAETAYRQSLLLRPRHFDTQMGLARALLPQRRPQECLALAGELLAHRPAQRELWALRADALLQLDQLREAAVCLETARRLGAVDAAMLATLGDLHIEAEQPEQALSAYQESFAATNATPARLLRAIEGFLLIQNAEGARTLAARLDGMAGPDGAKLDRDLQTQRLRMMGDLARLQGDATAARRHYEALLALDPLDGRALLRVAELHRAGDRLEDAALFCERAARMPGVQADALLLHAQIEVQRGAYPRAVSLIEAARVLAPGPRVDRYLEQVRRLAETVDGGGG